MSRNRGNEMTQNDPRSPYVMECDDPTQQNNIDEEVDKMTKVIRITVDVVNLDADDVNAKYEIDTGYEPRVVTVAYEDTEEVTVYEEANELAHCIDRIASAG